jgi:hypothetical protein
MPKLLAGLDAKELTVIALTIGGAALTFFALAKVQDQEGGADGAGVPVIDPATATPIQDTVPQGGALSDYWSYNQPAFYSLATQSAGGTPAAIDNTTGQAGYTGPDFASYLLSNLASLLSSAPGTAADLTNAWVNNTASATPTNTGSPPPTGAAPATTSPIIQVPPVAPYVPAVLSPPPPPVVLSPPPPAFARPTVHQVLQ